MATAMPSSAPPPRWFWPLVLFGAALAIEMALYLHPAWADYLGLGVYLGWFLDTHALLAAGEAWARGYDVQVFLDNPLDAYNRPHSYSSWWFVLGEAGLTRADLRWLGPTLVVTFTAAAVAALRPTSLRDAGIKLLVLAAPPMLLGLVRANNDLVVFLVLALVPLCAASRRVVVQMLAAFLILFATGLKFYPIVAAVLLLHGSSARLVAWRGVVTAVLAVLVGLGVYGDTLFFSRSLPNPGGLYSFGAPAALALFGLDGLLPKLMVLVGVAGGFWWLSEGGAPWREAGKRPPADARSLAVVLGAVLLCGCFWAGMNWGYRWIFALWIVPALLAPSPGCWFLDGWVRRALLALLFASLWWEGAVYGVAKITLFGMSGIAFGELCTWLITPVHWLCMGLLTALVGRFALDAGVRFVREVRG